MSGMSDKSRELSAFAPALVLLAIFALINCVDRGNLSIAAPLLKDELRFSATQLGIFFSACFWTYTALQLVSGWTGGNSGVPIVLRSPCFGCALRRTTLPGV